MVEEVSGQICRTVTSYDAFTLLFSTSLIQSMSLNDFWNDRMILIDVFHEPTRPLYFYLCRIVATFGRDSQFWCPICRELITIPRGGVQANLTSVSLPVQDCCHLCPGLAVSVPDMPGADHHTPGRGAGPPPLLPGEPVARPHGQPAQGGHTQVLQPSQPGTYRTRGVRAVQVKCRVTFYTKIVHTVQIRPLALCLLLSSEIYFKNVFL
jgi:hypothetical protein